MPGGNGTGPMGQGQGRGFGGSNPGPGGNCVCPNCGETSTGYSMQYGKLPQMRQ